MTSIGVNPNIPEKRDLNSKEVKNNLGIESIKEISKKNPYIGHDEDGEYNLTKVDDVIGDTQANHRDEIFFKADGKNYVASGKQIDVDAFESSLESSSPIKMNGKDISIKFVDDEGMELNSLSAQNKFNIEGIRELNTVVGDAVGDDQTGFTEHDGLDEVFFRSEGKDYVAYGKHIDTDAVDEADNIAKGSSNPITFNGKEANIIQIDDEANTFKEGVTHGIESDIGRVVIGGAFAVGFGAGMGGGAITAGILSLGSAAAATTVVGLVGGIAGAFNKPDYSGLDQVANPENLLTKDKKVAEQDSELEKLMKNAHSNDPAPSPLSPETEKLLDDVIKNNNVLKK